MIRDELGLLVSETSTWPGSCGDSAANSCRSEVLNPQDPHRIGFKFLTETGFVRHPTSLWREDDFSGDQLLPLFMAGPSVIREIIKNRNPYKAGNGTWHSPLTYAIIWGHHYAANLFLWLQLQLMTKIPYRWSDADGLKWYQRLEKTEGSSADWLNWFAACVYLKRRGKLYVTPNLPEVASKVYSYYQGEPNNKDILLDYEEAFKLWL